MSGVDLKNEKLFHVEHFKYKNEKKQTICHGGLDPPSHEKTCVNFHGIEGLRYAAPAMTSFFN